MPVDGEQSDRTPTGPKNLLRLFPALIIAGCGPILVAWSYATTPLERYCLLFTLIAYLFFVGGTACCLALWRTRRFYSPAEIPSSHLSQSVYNDTPQASVDLAKLQKMADLYARAGQFLVKGAQSPSPNRPSGQGVATERREMGDHGLAGNSLRRGRTDSSPSKSGELTFMQLPLWGSLHPISDPDKPTQ